MTLQRQRRIASVAVTLFAVLACLSGIDRTSERRPTLVLLIPALFQSHAARAEAAKGLADGDSLAAAKAARRAIRADPLDRRGPTFLAAAMLARGDDLAAAQAFAVADRIGQREPLVQAWFFGRAMERGAYAAAARRINILQRVHPDLSITRQLRSQLETRPAARRELLHLEGATVFNRVSE